MPSIRFQVVFRERKIDQTHRLITCGKTAAGCQPCGGRGETRKAARALKTLGAKSGGSVCILGFNRPEWVITDIATMLIGGAPAGIYTTCSLTEVVYIVNYAEAKVTIVEDAEQLDKIRAEKTICRS